MSPPTPPNHTHVLKTPQLEFLKFNLKLFFYMSNSLEITYETVSKINIIELRWEDSIGILERAQELDSNSRLLFNCIN